jgi:hypothetical protein
MVFVQPCANCTGLGDRVGTMLTLAALGRSLGAKVVFLWCDGLSEIFSRMLPHIPRWRGYNFSLTEFKTRFSPPEVVVLVERVTDEHKKLPQVQWREAPNADAVNLPLLLSCQ